MRRVLILLIATTTVLSADQFTGNWEGTAPNGKKVKLQFNFDNTVELFLRIPRFPNMVKASYSFEQRGDIIHIDIYDIQNEAFNKYKLLGIIKYINVDEFLFFAVPATDNRAIRPTKFDRQALRFKKQN
jgi:hypothetical protein